MASKKRVLRGLACGNCRDFVVLDDVTDGARPIQGGIPAPVAAYSLTPLMKCGACGQGAHYHVWDLVERAA